MPKKISILTLEDVASDAELVERELQKAGIAFNSHRVESREAFIGMLNEFQPDIILADYKLSQFTGLDALRLLKERQSDIPFILVTGSQTEEVAVQCMKEGADDYILKSSLIRLPAAMLNALKNREMQRDKERAEVALRRREEQYRLITENSRDLISMLDPDGKFVYVSPSYGDRLGFTPDELIGTSFFELIHPEDRDNVVQGFYDTSRSESGQAEEFRCTNKEGDWRTLQSIGKWIVDSSEKPQCEIVVSRDITERQQIEQTRLQLEEQLRHSQKMEAIGQLAGGIAHDFNNTLMAISGYCELLLLEMQAEDPLRKEVIGIQNATIGAAVRTRQLLAFSTRQFVDPRVMDLNVVLANMNKMLRRLIGENIELHASLAADLWKIKADQSQIEQIIMNLTVNARDAMPDGGQLVIETSNATLDEKYAEDHLDVKPGDYVLLTVSDTGGGMTQETKAHIFEPFFTTKEKGKGTGLGLPTVYGIVKQSEGLIEVESQLGKGTRFQIYFPRCEHSFVERDQF